VKRGCDLLILFFKATSKDRSLVSLDSSYKVCVRHKKAPIACMAMGAFQ